MSFSLKDAMTECPGLCDVVEKAAEEFGRTGGFPSGDKVQVTVIITHVGKSNDQAGYATGVVSGVRHLMDETFVED